MVHFKASHLYIIQDTEEGWPDTEGKDWRILFLSFVSCLQPAQWISKAFNFSVL